MSRRHFKCKNCGEIYLSAEEGYLRDNPLAADGWVWEKKQEHLDWCPKEKEITRKEQ